MNIIDTKLKKIVFLIILGILIKILFFSLFLPLATDSREFNIIARNITLGKGYIVNPDEKINLSRWPFYPCFISVCYFIFGVRNYKSVIVIQIIFDIFVVYLLFNLFLKLFKNERLAFIGTLIYVIFPHIARYNTWMMSEYFSLFFLICISYALIVNENRMLFKGIVTGILMGLLFLTKPRMGIYIVFFLFFIPFFEKSFFSIIKFCASIIISFILIISLWYGYQLKVNKTINIFPVPLTINYHNSIRYKKLENWSIWFNSWNNDVKYQTFFWCLPTDINSYPKICFTSENEKKEFKEMLNKASKKVKGKKIFTYGNVPLFFLDYIGKIGKKRLKNEGIKKYLRYLKVSIKALFYTDYIALFRAKYYSLEMAYITSSFPEFLVITYSILFKYIFLISVAIGFFIFIIKRPYFPNFKYGCYFFLIFFIQFEVLTIFRAFIPRYYEIVFPFLIPFSVLFIENMNKLYQKIIK